MGETNTVHFVRVYLSYTKNAFIHPPTTQLLGTDGCGLEEKWH